MRPLFALARPNYWAAFIVALFLSCIVGSARAGGPCNWQIVAGSESVGYVWDMHPGPEDFCAIREAALAFYGYTLVTCVATDGLVIEEVSLVGSTKYYTWVGSGPSCTAPDDPDPPASAASGAAASEATAQGIEFASQALLGCALFGSLMAGVSFGRNSA